MNIIKNPTSRHLEDIKKWLKEEEEEFGNSFICNWEIIEECFSEKRMIITANKDCADAFFIWSDGEKVVQCLIAVVKPALRAQGLGSKFINEVLKILRQDFGVWAVELQCKPLQSESFWRQNSFIDYPAKHPIRNEYGTHLYKNLFQEEKSIESKLQPVLLEIWCREPFGVSDKDEPDFQFTTTLKKESKIFPAIVFPVSNDWTVKIKINGETINKGKVKYVLPHNSRREGFITLDELSSIEGIQSKI